MCVCFIVGFFFSSRRRHTRCGRDWSSDVCSSDLRIDAGERADLEAGMAKLFCSETAMQIALDAIRIHGGYGYSTEFDVERYFRDAPLMIVGEGTNEIQRTVIVRQLVRRNRVR